MEQNRVALHLPNHQKFILIGDKTTAVQSKIILKGGVVEVADYTNALLDIKRTKPLKKGEVKRKRKSRR